MSAELEPPALFKEGDRVNVLHSRHYKNVLVGEDLGLLGPRRGGRRQRLYQIFVQVEPWLELTCAPEDELEPAARNPEAAP